MSLEVRLRERIQREGPISFYEWMKAALYDERDGYYCTDRARQGRTGDYRTAPETSPLFAATFANYFAKLFDELGSPSQFTIIEVGAGSGDFPHGVLTTLRAEHPEVFTATNYLIEEISKGSGDRCAARLAEFSDHVSVRSPTIREGQTGKLALPIDHPTRDARVGTPVGRASDTICGVIFSNELIDAFPVNRVVMRAGKLRQLFVGVHDASFVWVEGKPEKSVHEYFERVRLDLREGQVFEINLDADAFITRAAASLNAGYVVTVDYGAERRDLLSDPNRHDGTLRAFRQHQFAGDVLARPGEQDLTTTVDWTQIREAGEAAGLRMIRFERLDEFLIAEGLLDRISNVAKSSTDMAAAARLTTGARELILPTGMAASFQVLVQEKIRGLSPASTRRVP